MMTHAASRARISLVGTSTKLGLKTLTRILVETNVTVVFVDSDLMGQLLAPLVECPSVTTIIYNPTTLVPDDQRKTKTESRQLRRGLNPNLRIMSVEQFLDFGALQPGVNKESEEEFDTSSDAYLDSVWEIAYPGVLNPAMPAKGVIHSNRNIVSIGMYFRFNIKYSIQLAYSAN